jgi:nitroreductase
LSGRLPSCRHSWTFKEIGQFRHSNRHFDANTPVIVEVIQRSLERVALSPNSFHTCPMQGLVRVRVRRFLGLPREAEINMAVAVVLRTLAGVWGPRYRVPVEVVVLLQ